MEPGGTCRDSRASSPLGSELIAGKRAITPETAKALGEAFNTGGRAQMGGRF